MELISNRTEADVLLGNEKGKYRSADLNRVEQAVAELCALAKPLDLYLKLETRTDWGAPGMYSISNWPTDEQMQRYLSNVNQLCNAVSLDVGLPATMENLTWEGANQIERALLCVETRIQSILNTIRYSGEFYAGEENGL